MCVWISCGTVVKYLGSAASTSAAFLVTVVPLSPFYCACMCDIPLFNRFSWGFCAELQVPPCLTSFWCGHHVVVCWPMECTMIGHCWGDCTTIPYLLSSVSSMHHYWCWRFCFRLSLCHSPLTCEENGGGCSHSLFTLNIQLAEVLPWLAAEKLLFGCGPLYHWCSHQNRKCECVCVCVF